MYANRKNPAQ